MKILLNWSKISFQIKYNDRVSNFGIFEKPKVEQNDFECQWNIDYDSYAVDCLSSGHVCHVRTMLYVRFMNLSKLYFIFLFNYCYVVCTD